MIGYIILGVILAVIILVTTFYLISRSKGKIILEVQKKDFVVGEIIKGTIKLNLKKQVEANSLSLNLSGIRKTSGGKHSHSSSRKIFETTKQIDTHKKYNTGESVYGFELLIPEDAKPKIENPVFDTLLKTAQFIGGQRIDWYLTAYLDIKGFDLRRTIKIYIN